MSRLRAPLDEGSVVCVMGVPWFVVGLAQWLTWRNYDHIETPIQVASNSYKNVIQLYSILNTYEYLLLIT